MIISEQSIINERKLDLRMRKKRKRLSLKKVYYLAFFLLIVIPLLLVLMIALLILNQQFKKQAVENIERAQENIVTELISDINVMSMRLTHLAYTNNNEIIGYAAGTDTEDVLEKYDYEQKLFQAGNLALEPVKDIVSVGFYMKDGRETYIKNTINRSVEEIRKEVWYQEALEHPNSVYVGSYDTTSMNDLYLGGKKDLLVLVFALSPDVKIDRSQKIEMVTFYQLTGSGDTIREYNQEYVKGRNKLGIMQVAKNDGDVIFSTVEQTEYNKSEYTCVRTPVQFGENVWYIESYIKTGELTQDFWKVAWMILAIAVLIFVMAGCYSAYFLRSIIKPMEEISSGLRQVEEGNIGIHITPKGQFEVRSMIHQFNAMVRRLHALIDEYEEKMKGAAKSQGDYFADLLKQNITPQEVSRRSHEFFEDNYVILGFSVDKYAAGKNDMESARLLTESFERNLRFSSRCLIYPESPRMFLVFYRITEEDYVSRAMLMIQELQNMVEREFGVDLAVCIGRERTGWAQFEDAVREVKENICLRFLFGVKAVVDLQHESRRADRIIALSETYQKLADSLLIADEKNMTEERDKLFDILGKEPREEWEMHIMAAILAIANRFETDNFHFWELFEKKYNYPDKLSRLEENRSVKIWLTNYFAWIMDYTAGKLNLMETDVIVKAKRYISDNYEDADLSLSKVAECVGLNEKYFTNRFTKETGETFSSYLTKLRLQKAKELLKTTTFKIYEISEMVGYNNVEHFNRMFKKQNKMTPAQYRKTM